MFWVVSPLMRLVFPNWGNLLSNCLGEGKSQKAETVHLLGAILFPPSFPQGTPRTSWLSWILPGHSKGPNQDTGLLRSFVLLFFLPVHCCTRNDHHHQVFAKLAPKNPGINNTKSTTWSLPHQSWEIHKKDQWIERPRCSLLQMLIFQVSSFDNIQVIDIDINFDNILIIFRFNLQEFSDFSLWHWGCRNKSQK